MACVMLPEGEDDSFTRSASRRLAVADSGNPMVRDHGIR